MNIDRLIINKLSPDVVNQIAAGEVVERPSHLVKELLENAWDAGATKIHLEVSKGGRSVKVTDNGCGIVPEQMSLALERFATSKIQAADDLWKLQSFGFRGEALASIASVSRLVLTSRQAGAELASELVSEFGTLGEVSQVGSGFGTTVFIDDLFKNVPARLKFLKSEASEYSVIRSVVKAMALSHPNSEIRYLENGKLYFFWNATSSLKDRVEQVFGCSPMYDSESHKSSTINLHCRVVFASPRHSVKNSKNIWIFVQNRWVQDRGVQAAVLEAYRSLLMIGEYPQVAIWLNTDPECVDVNIHPNKSQVRFQDSSLAFRAVQGALRSGLERAPWISKPDFNFNITKFETNPANPVVKSELMPEINSEAKSGLKSEVNSFNSYRENLKFLAPEFELTRLKTKESSIEYDSKIESKLESKSEREKEKIFGHEFKKEIVSPPLTEKNELISKMTAHDGYWSSLQVLGQAHQTYILTQSDRALILVDQHAAHERILFERLMRNWKMAISDGTKEKSSENCFAVQNYLIPLILDFSPEKLAALAPFLSDLSKMGIIVEVLGVSSLAIKGAPAILTEGSIVKALEKMAEEIFEHGGSFSFENSVASIHATLACHSAIRAGQALSIPEMRAVLEQMDEFPLSSFCPHGRPVNVEYSFREIEKGFGRIH